MRLLSRQILPCNTMPMFFNMMRARPPVQASEPIIDLLFLAAMLVIGFLLARHAWNHEARSSANSGRNPSVLDSEFLALHTGIPYLVRDLVQGGILITGQSGSGKTSGPLRKVIDSAISMNFGLTLLSAKPEDRADYLAMAAKWGRAGDVILIDETATHCLNFFDSLQLKSADPATRARQLAQSLDVFTEVASRNGTKGGGGDERFWVQAAGRMTFVLILLLILADQQVTPANILKLVTTLPRTPKDLISAQWKARLCSQCLRAAFDAAKASGDSSNFTICDDYITLEICTLSPKTRTVIEAFLTGNLDILSTGIASRILASESTFDLAAAIGRNAIIIVDFPYTKWLGVGQFIGAGVKHLVQTEILKREAVADTLPHLIVADECTNVLTEHDYAFASLCRSFRGCLIYATQGVESLRAAYPGSNADDKVSTLVGNLGTIFAASPTPTTAKWLCDMFGREKKFSTSSSTTIGGQNRGSGAADNQTSASVSEVFESVLQASELMRMRTGGPRNGFIVDALLIKAGAIFPRTGCNFCPVSFRQEKL